MKKQLLTLLLAGASVGTFAQTELSNWTATGRGGVATTFVTDYQALGINPSNLGWTSKYEGKTVTLGFLDLGASLYAEALSKDEVRNTFIKQIQQEDLTIEEKQNAAIDFTDAGFAINIDAQWFGAAVTTKKAGGFAISVRDRVRWYNDLSKDASEIMFLGFNAPYFDQTFYTTNLDTIATTNPDSINYSTASVPSPFSDIMNGSKISMTWYREFNLGYGIALKDGDDLSIYAGVGAKYLQGLGYVDVRADGDELVAYSALAPGFGVDYGSGSLSNPSAIQGDTTSFSSVGSGMGFDLGLSVIIKKKLKLGLAITDIGSITWDGNVYTANDTLLLNTNNDGLNSVNLFSEASDFTGENGVFSWGGVNEL